MNVDLRIRIAEQPAVLTRNSMREAELIYDKEWTGSGNSKG
jgi:hypothetical protein